MLAHQVKACQAIQENNTDIRDRYEYRKIIVSRKQYKISNSSQPLIEESINCQAGNKQASEHSSRAKQAGGTDSKQCLITSALDRATGMTRLRRLV